MESARELLAQGQVEKALASVNGVLTREPRNVEALLLRSTLRTRKGEAILALDDAEQAVRFSNGSAESQLRRLIALWRLQEYGKAKGVARLLDDGQAATMWKSMVTARAEPEENVERIPAQLQRSGGSVPPQPPKVDWYQSGNIVHVALYRKGLDKESTKVGIEENQLSVVSGEFSWTQKLGSSIARESSTHEITAYKVEFTLQKQESLQWNSLESGATEAAQIPQSAKPTPQTSYSKWEHIDDNDDDAEKKNSDPNAFFQQLYQSSTPEVQRAMMKSFVESNGTALSTNWDEVKKGKVETQPPKDMEARSWN